MSHINTANLVIPDDISSSWQNNINLIAEIMSIPTALIVDTQKTKLKSLNQIKIRGAHQTLVNLGLQIRICCWVEDERIMLAKQDQFYPRFRHFLVL